MPGAHRSGEGVRSPWNWSYEMLVSYPIGRYCERSPDPWEEQQVILNPSHFSRLWSLFLQSQALAGKQYLCISRHSHVCTNCTPQRLNSLCCIYPE